MVSLITSFDVLSEVDISVNPLQIHRCCKTPYTKDTGFMVNENLSLSISISVG